MEFTGERYMPGMNAQIEAEHLHRYYLAREYAAGLQVLDIACGEGYGTALLSEVADFVYGVDVAQDALEHCNKNYGSRDNIKFIHGDCASIPLPDNSVDFICSFETIEHHSQHDQMMLELVRVLRPDGIVMLSSPDKAVYSDAANYSNPFHVKELYRHELESLISRYFSEHRLQQQKVFYGSQIQNIDKQDDFIHYELKSGRVITGGLLDAPYFILLASNSKLPKLYCGLLETNLEKSEYVVHLENTIMALNSKVEGFRKRKKWFRNLFRMLKKTK